MADDFSDPKYRFQRAELLHAAAIKLHGAARACDFRNEIVVRPQGIFVNVGGVLMDVSHTSMYLKSSGHVLPNQAEALDRALKRFGISVSTVVDVGANFGELALWFARAYPRARVLAIEPSSANLKVLRRNLAAQPTETANLEVLQTAVGASAGMVTLTKGAGSMARVVAGDGDITQLTEQVSCDRLDNLFARHAIGRADFVKIDIEGSEPTLRDALVALRGCVGAYYIEFSQFASIDGYLALADSLLTQGFTCYEERAEDVLSDAGEIEGHLRQGFAAGPMAVRNLWFVAA